MTANATAQAQFQQGLALHQQGKLAQAQTLYQQTLQLQPQHFDALHLLGVIAHQTRQFAQAVDLISQALRLNPHHALAHTNLGVALKELGQYQAAVASYDQAIALNPRDAQTHLSRGNALCALQQYQAAVASYDHALDLQANLSEAYHHRGFAYGHLQQYPAAIADYDRAIALQAASAPLYTERGICLAGLAHYRAAIESYEQAIALDANHVPAHFNRGFALEQLNQIQAAVESYEQVIALQADYAAAHWNQSMCFLQLGDFERGWKKYEWRRQLKGHPACIHQKTAPLWLGQEPLQGKTILLHVEGGFGDELHFCRYVKLVRALGAKVILEVKRPLVALLQQLEGADLIMARGDPLPAVDYQCSLLSLPLAFQTTLSTIYAPNSYIQSHPEKLAYWQAKLGPKTQTRVGLVWSGSPTHVNDRQRSIPLDNFVQRLPPHIQYISLKKDIPDSGHASLQAHPDILHFGQEIQDFSDTAALCKLVDLVISVDTSVAHLAGAMGRPVWILLAFHPDWRWLLDRTDSPWYPSARLYRQDQRGDWTGVLEQVATDLKAAHKITSTHLQQHFLA